MSKAKILIVDDKPQNIFTLKKIFKNLDVEFICASNAKDALTATLNHDFAVALIDVQMSGMDGFELVRYMRQEKKTQILPVIFILATSIEDHNNFMDYESGAIDFITKPLNPKILISKVKIYLELYNNNRQLETINKKLYNEIEERRQKERLLRQSEENLTGIIDSITDSMTMMDRELNIVWANDAAKRLFGTDLIGKKCYSAYHRRNKPCKPCLVRKTFADGKIHQHESAVKGADGQEMVFWCTSSVVEWDKDGRPEFVIKISPDITKHKQVDKEFLQSRQELQDLSEHLESVREGERRQITREIHDEMGQSLTALKMDISLLSQSFNPNIKQHIHFKEKAESIEKHIDTVIESLHRICSKLRPGLLDDLGLIPTLEWQAQDFQERTKIKCDVDLGHEDLDLDPALSTAVFRIFQASLTNIARHAKATKVSIHLKRFPGWTPKLQLTIKDNGRGITEQQIKSSRSFGLMGIRERLRPFRGTLEIEGTPNHGSTLTVNLPLP